jgi:UDP-hydrolysing UDP-N-acetyl-D-glucosamine 2-epimerase
MSDPTTPAASGGRRTIAVLTTGRQDWGILRSTCVALRDRPDLDLRLIVGGTHLANRYGHTVDLVRADGFVPDLELDWLGPGGDAPADAQAGRALETVGAALRSEPPDAIVLAGDRFETAAAAIAATLARVPIAHIHGGEQTGGAFDDQLRHAITKLSHLHLVSNEEHARRVERLGWARIRPRSKSSGPRGSTRSCGRTSPTGRSWRPRWGSRSIRRWSS